MSDSVDHMVVVSTNSMTRTFATCIADQSDSKGYVIEEEKRGVMAFIVATKQISALLKGIKKTLDSDRSKAEKFDLLVLLLRSSFSTFELSSGALVCPLI